MPRGMGHAARVKKEFVKPNAGRDYSGLRPFESGRCASNERLGKRLSDSRISMDALETANAVRDYI